VRPGDRVAVKIWREPEMSDTITVDQDGVAVFPRLGATPIGGLTAGKVQSDIRDAYAAFLRDPVVEVTVLRRIGIHGEVSEPSLYLVDLTTTLRELIAMAGGVTEAGNPNNITIVRGEEHIRIGRDESARFRTAELRSGDQVVVGRRSYLARNPLAVISAAAALISTIALIIR